MHLLVSLPRRQLDGAVETSRHGAAVEEVRVQDLQAVQAYLHQYVGSYRCS
jgi:hypothetical protein